MTSIWEREGESGLLDNFEFTITKAWFGPHEKYQDGTVPLLQWEGTTNDLNTPITNVWYSFGTGWVSKDGGESIVHESGDPKKFFQKQSQYYKIINRCGVDFGLADLMDERGDPFHAATWVGMKFRMLGEEQEAIKDRETGEMGPKRTKTMPVEFLGVVDGTEAKAKASAAAPKATKAAAGKESAKEKMARLTAEKAAAKAEADGAGDGELSIRDQVIAALQSSDDFEVAQAAALEIENVMDDDDLVSELMDETGLFAEAQAALV